MGEKIGAPTPDRRRLLEAELGRQFKMISEEAACSLWAYQIEDELPPLLIEAAEKQEAVNYQWTEISPIYAKWLVSIASELGHWVTQGHGEGYVAYLPKNLRPNECE